MNDLAPSIFISHAWGGESEKIVNAIVQRFAREGIEIIFDKKDLGYRQSISKFMHKLGQADAIILVVSNKYLHSEYCMFELLEIYENQNIIQRIFPVVLDEVKIAKSTERLDLVKFWEKETQILEDKIRELKTLGHIEGITDDLNLYHNIRNKIAKLTSILKDINTLNIGLHRDSDFNALVDAVKNSLPADTAISNAKTPDKPPVKTTEEHKDSSSKKPSKKWRLWLILSVLVLGTTWTSLSYFSPKKTSVQQIHTDSLDLSLNPSTSIPTDSSIENNIGEESLGIAVEELPEQKNHKADPKPTKKTEVQDNIKTKTTGIIKEEQEELASGRTNYDSIQTKNKPVTESAEKKIRKVRSFFIPEQYIEGVLASDISSKSAEEDMIIYFRTTGPLVIDQQTIITKNAKIRAKITQAKNNSSSGKSVLAFKVEAVESMQGEWLDIVYPEYSDKKIGVIIFEEGLKLSKLKLKSTTLKLTL